MYIQNLFFNVGVKVEPGHSGLYNNRSRRDEIPVFKNRKTFVSDGSGELDCFIEFLKPVNQVFPAYNTGGDYPVKGC